MMDCLLETEKSIFFDKLIDTHVHFYELKKKSLDVNYIINECFKNGFSYFIDVGLHPSDFNDRKNLLSSYSNVLLTAGIHPLNLDDNFKDDVKQLEKILISENVVAVGEMGLDYFKANNKKFQIKVFEEQLYLAVRYKKPVILHIRDAYDDAYNIVKSLNFSNRGILHCYSGTYECAKKFIDLGFKVSFSGNITFKNAELLRIVASKLNTNDLLIETDSPFLAPVPLRGKINSPLFLGYVCLEIARIKNCSVNDIAIALYNSFKELLLLH
ncbi:TatD family hydrolase [Borreliella yangtzensis]|uniref:TatD DNase family protein n=1 Tax=Borreliella yangtzensis TaxID=683292 RepID=A0ABR6P9W2_9SPIR|nr:TatD family hydrolase [Borreliella yangtzensis]MBB6043052.1 TatD DNase family protein [Borreliella yangtzensis]WKC73179.1 TatD family hydrolase [Borreliella yangtzensis]WKC74096.1 TatD family hydrolase [Borreliella yangtzensis]